MKIKKLIIPVLMFFGISLFAGAEPGVQNIGSLNPAQANVLLLQDKIDATSDTITVQEHRIVKILTPAAIQRYGTLQFTYAEPNEKVEINNVQLTTPNGKTTPVSLLDVKESTPLQKFQPFSALKAIELNIKDLKPGETLDYTFTMTNHPWIANAHWQEIFLQDLDPIQQEQIILTEKDSNQADVQLFHGTLPEAKVSTAPGLITREWDFSSLPAFNPEFSMPPAADVAPRLIISTVKNWQDITQGFQRQFLMPTSDASLNKTLAGIVKKDAKPAETLNAIYSFVAQNIRSLPPDIGGEVEKIPHPLDYDSILNLGIGDCRDKAALLQALLQKAGFNAELALLSTTSNGKVVPSMPMPFIFNRLIVRVVQDSKVTWLDPYSENAPTGYLPPEDQGQEALFLSNAQFLETPVFPPSANLREINAEAMLSSNGNLKEILSLNATGADGFALRSVLRNIPDQERRQVIASLATQVSHASKVDAVSLSSVENLNAPMALGIKFQAKNYATVIGDLTFLPLPINVLNTFTSILALTGQRQYPFIIGNTIQETKHLELMIPKGYAIRTLPKGKTFENSIGAYQASFSKDSNKLIFESSFTIAKTSVDADEFQKLKDLITNKINLEESKIVLMKVGAVIPKKARKKAD